MQSRYLGSDASTNLSQTIRTLGTMKATDITTNTPELVFADPVAFLAGFGIEAEIVEEPQLAAAA